MLPKLIHTGEKGRVRWRTDRLCFFKPAQETKRMAKLQPEVGLQGWLVSKLAKLFMYDPDSVRLTWDASWIASGFRL